MKLPRSFDCPPDVGDTGRACVRPSQSQRPVARISVPLTAGRAASGGFVSSSDAGSNYDDEHDVIPPPTSSVPTGRGPVWSSPGRPRSPAPTMPPISSPAPSTISGTGTNASVANTVPDLRPGGGQMVLDLSQPMYTPTSNQSQNRTSSSQPTVVSETTAPLCGKIYRGRLETFILPGELPSSSSSSAGLDITSSLLGEALQGAAGTWFDFIAPSM